MSYSRKNKDRERFEDYNPKRPIKRKSRRQERHKFKAFIRPFVQIGHPEIPV